jgi:hypothetical protein
MRGSASSLRQDRLGCIVGLAGIDGFKGVEFNEELPT